MTLPDLKQLKELLKLLRANGVLQYQSSELNLVLAESAPVLSHKSKAQEIMEEDEEEKLTPEQEYERLLFYSSDSPAKTESEQ